MKMTRVVHARLDAGSDRILRRLCRRTGWKDSEAIRRGLAALAATVQEGGAKVKGVGRFWSGVRDLGSNKKHLRRFGAE